MAHVAFGRNGEVLRPEHGCGDTAQLSRSGVVALAPLLSVADEGILGCVKNRREMSLICEVGTLATRFDVISDYLARELHHASVFEDDPSFGTAASKQRRGVCSRNIKALMDEVASILTALTACRSSLLMFSDTNRSVAEELAPLSECAHVARGKRHIAAVEEALARRIEWITAGIPEAAPSDFEAFTSSWNVVTQKEDTAMANDQPERAPQNAQSPVKKEPTGAATMGHVSDDMDSEKEGTTDIVEGTQIGHCNEDEPFLTQPQTS